MREVISVHVGQAGVQIGNACCKFFLLDGEFHCIACREAQSQERVVSLYVFGIVAKQKVA
jgi:hypothetical protein